MVNPINNAPVGAPKTETAASDTKTRAVGARKASAANTDAAHISTLAEKARTNEIAGEPAIRDADEAYEMMELVKDAILQQNGAAIAAQANLSPMRILGLI